jgi:xanthine dehydrogenase accessory factor
MAEGSRLVAVRGGGEMASAVAHLLFSRGFRVFVLEREAPLAVRRLVSFAEAVWSGSTRFEGVTGRKVAMGELPGAIAAREFVPVVVDPGGESLARLRPAVIVDARMAKKNLGTSRDQAALVIGLGPGFEAGVDVHAVIETQRGGEMGRAFWSGRARSDTSVPGPVLGFTDERVLRAPRSGVFRSACSIGDVVSAGARVGDVDGEAVVCRISGLVRGLLADGVAVDAGVKLGDVDPRGAGVDPARISDKGQAVSRGVLDAILLSCARRP